MSAVIALVTDHTLTIVSRSHGRVRATELPPEIVAAYDAPFPDDRYKAGARAFPMLVPAL